MDDISQKLILFGIGLIVGGLLCVGGLILHLFPDYKVRRTWKISIGGFVLGVIFIIAGIVMSKVGLKVNGVFVPDILIALGAIGYTAHLIYARYNPEWVERKNKKYKTGTREHAIYHKIYTPQFLVIATIMTLSFVLSLAVDIFGLVHGSIPIALKTVEFVIRMTAGLAVLYLLYVLFWRDR